MADGVVQQVGQHPFDHSQVGAHRRQFLVDGGGQALLARLGGQLEFLDLSLIHIYFGLPVHTLYQRERMRAAWDLIATGGLSVSQAGLRLGYTNMSHFSSAFKRVHDVLPNQVKRGG